jgi:hypothetical protein
MNNKTSIIFFLICGIILFSASCSYKPQLTSIPLLEEKGDLQIAGTLSPATISASLTASYAITDHFAAQIFGDIGANMSFGQGAIGYFNKFSDRLVFENYSGFGYGHSYVYLDAEPSSITGNHYLGFTQFNIGENYKSSSLTCDYGAGIKIGYLFHNGTTYESIMRDIDWIETETPHKMSSIVVEPNLFIRLGGERLKFSIQGNLCFLHSLNHRNELLYYPFNLGFGISYRFPVQKNINDDNNRP